MVKKWKVPKVELSSSSSFREHKEYPEDPELGAVVSIVSKEFENNSTVSRYLNHSDHVIKLKTINTEVT